MTRSFYSVMKTAAPAPALVLSALIAVQVLFGVNYVVSKLVVGSFPPLVWASLRIIIASAIMICISLISGRKSPTGRAFFIPLIGFALLGNIINQASFLVGLHYTTATNSAILNTLIPVFTLLIVALRGQEPVTWRKVVGFVLAFSGVLVIRKVEDISFSNRTVVGDLLTILNCLSYGFFLSYSKKFRESYDPLWTTTWMFIYGGIGLTTLAIPDWLNFQWPVMTTGLMVASLFAIIGATLLTYFLNFWALAYAKSSQVALFIYLQPIVASLTAWLWHGEIVTFRTVLASLFIFAGLLFASSKSE